MPWSVDHRLMLIHAYMDKSLLINWTTISLEFILLKSKNGSKNSARTSIVIGRARPLPFALHWVTAFRVQNPKICP
jgi:hypothetical protein